MENVEIARILNAYADLLDIKGENPFRVGSYRKAAQSLKTLSRPVAELFQEGKDFTDIPSIGRSMAAHLKEIIETGKFSNLQTLQKKFPRSLVDLIHLEYLGPKKVKQLYNDLGVSSLSKLKKALMSGKVESLPGFGKISVKKIQRAIKEFEQHHQRFRIADADQLIRPFLDHMRQGPGLEKVEIAGSYRRRKETIGDVDVLVTCQKPSPVMQHFKKFPLIRRVENAGSTRGTILLRSGLKIDLRIVPPEAYGAALHYFTGSKAHNITVRKLGGKKGLRINEYGIFRLPRGKMAEQKKKNPGKRIGGSTEKQVYQAVGMIWVPPELRENRGELEEAKKGVLPKLIELEDIRGNLHMHSKWTDGQNTIGEMARACQDLGYQYCAITDHSRSTRIAGGLTAKDLKKQWTEISKVRNGLKGIQLLASAEVDILPDGSLDYSDDVLENLDIVVASVHSHLTMSKGQMTKRIIKAISNPTVDIIGHPTERQINERGPVEVDLEEVFQAAKEYDVALELNAQPKRLDLNDVYVKRTKEIGVKVAINSDAHSTNQLSFMRYGIDQARRGWLEKSNVVNTLTWAMFEKWLRRRR